MGSSRFETGKVAETGRNNAIEKWSDEWLVTFSVPKTKSMIISNKMDRNNHPQVLSRTMHNSVLEDVDLAHHRHLGLVLSNNLGWTNHIGKNTFTIDL